MDRRSYGVLFLVSVALLLAGCDALEQSVGPCDVRWESPLIEITHAKAEDSDEPISTVSLTNFVVDSNAIGPQFLEIDDEPNVEIDGDTLRCTIPCAFGRQQGNYAFTAAASGYESTRLELGEVEYTNREEEGPCPRIIFSGSQEVGIRLSPSSASPLRHSRVAASLQTNGASVCFLASAPVPSQLSNE